MAALTVAPVLVTACGMSGPCGAPFRTATASGDIIGPGGSLLGTVTLSLVESQDPSRSSLGVMTAGSSAETSAQLRGHVVKLRVLGAGARVLFTPAVQQLPASTTPGSALMEYITIPVTDTTLLADVRDQFLSGSMAVELTTDETPARVFTVSTRVTGSTDWIQAICK
jgi:hypothetical protein